MKIRKYRNKSEVIKMSDISKIDKNFAIKPVEIGEDTVFFNVLEEPFKVAYVPLWSDIIESY